MVASDSYGEGCLDRIFVVGDGGRWSGENVGTQSRAETLRNVRISIFPTKVLSSWNARDDGRALRHQS